MKTAFLVAAMLAATTAHADTTTAGRPPSWLLTTDWGMNMSPGEKDDDGFSTPDLGGSGGLTLAMQSLSGNHVSFGEFQAMPVGGYYMARAGFVWGARWKRPYYLWLGSSTVGNTTTNYYEIHPNSPIEWVGGLDVAVSAYHAPKGDRLVAEAGLGLIGQHRIDLLGLLDSSGAFGLRVTAMMFAGDRTSTSYGWRMGLQVFFDFDDNPVPLLFTFGFGAGGSFHIPNGGTTASL